MAQAPSKWNVYNQPLNELGKALWDFTAGHTFKVALFTSASSAINVAVNPATYTAFAADGHEVAAGNGYSTGGVSVGVSSWTDASGVEQFTLANASWQPTGAGITFRAAVIYDSTDASKRALAYCLGDSTPADVTAAAIAGQPLVISLGLWFVLKQQQQ